MVVVAVVAVVVVVIVVVVVGGVVVMAGCAFAGYRKTGGVRLLQSEIILSG